ncbi:MAG: DNA-binding domain-containing protein [Gammaproteobacteria bacterium]|nr:DNA-binding domain-containing protein [Gammaproteobacteria bacterium]
MQLADFERRIMQGITPVAATQDRQATEQMLKPGGELTAKECLAVYRNNITSTRVRALQAIYPVCETILGSDCFRVLAREFAWQAADACADLNVYGGQLAEYLGAQQRSNFSLLPYLKELARLEWNWHTAYYAADTAPFAYQSFSSAAAHPERLRFTLADGLALLETKYPVREIWQRHRARENPDSIPALEACEYLCIHRPDYGPQVTSLGKTTYVLLTRIQKGSTLEQLGDTAELSENLAELLPVLIQRGWVSGFQLLSV